MAESSSSNVRIGEYSEEHLIKLAKKMARKMIDGTRLFDDDPTSRIPKLRSSDLNIGRVLGRGGFCVVHEVTIKPESDDSGKDTRYAMKRVSTNEKTNAEKFVNGMIDLATEAKFLAALQHPNIIKIHGMAVGEACSVKFFCLLDRLDDILTTRLVTWRKHNQSGFRSRLTDRNGKRAQAFWVERIKVAHGIASALEYLHSRNIMYRDLKPDDVGFEKNGNVVLFDFGLAKEFEPSKADKTGCYKMTAGTGTPRFMAPEDAQAQPYNETVDVYSFGLLLFNILALEAPFEGLPIKSFPKLVYKKGARPVVDPKWPVEISAIMQKCWSPTIQDRPAMAEVTSVLVTDICSRTNEMDPLESSKTTQEVPRRSNKSRR